MHNSYVSIHVSNKSCALYSSIFCMHHFMTNLMALNYIFWLHLTWAEIPMKQTGQTGLGLTVFWCESRSDGSISSSADKSPCLHELILCNIAGLSTHRSMLHYATVSPCLLPLEKRNIRDKTKKYSKKWQWEGDNIGGHGSLPKRTAFRCQIWGNGSVIPPSQDLVQDFHSDLVQSRAAHKHLLRISVFVWHRSSEQVFASFQSAWVYIDWVKCHALISQSCTSHFCQLSCQNENTAKQSEQMACNHMHPQQYAATVCGRM